MKSLTKDQLISRRVQTQYSAATKHKLILCIHSRYACLHNLKSVCGKVLHPFVFVFYMLLEFYCIVDKLILP